MDRLAVLYLDFAKAIDTVLQGLLVDKLKKLGIGVKFLSLMHSYLTNMQQYVRIEDI